MDLHANIPLKKYTTMRLGGNAKYMTDLHSANEIQNIILQANQLNLPIFIIGGGSNVVVQDKGYDGIVLRNMIMGFETVAEDDSSVSFKIGAGENWDSVVKTTVEKNLSGIEAMSAIPGTMGAAPVQNIGAYGQELVDTFVSLEAYDLNEGIFVNLNSDDCQFSYRDSIFRSSQKGRYIITSVVLKLFKSAPVQPFYSAVQKYFDNHNINIFTPSTIRQAVIDIRTDKLPDPAIYPNSGSFFKNSIIEDWQLNDLQSQFSDIPRYDLGNNKYKIPSGWLIEQAGFKGQLINGIRIHDKNTLVLINESASSYHDLELTRDEIIRKVRDIFRIEIDQEPIEMP
mgnify:CR=1 FL=1